MAKQQPAFSIARPEPPANEQQDRENQLKAFVSGERDAKPVRGVTVRADGSTARRLTVYVPPELYRRCKVRAAELDSSLSDWVGEVLARELAARPCAAGSVKPSMVYAGKANLPDDR